MATSDIALERLQARLMVDTADGSMYDRAVRAVKALAPGQAPVATLAQLEALTRQLKSATRGPPAPDDNQPVAADAAVDERRHRWCEEIPALIRPLSDPASAPRVLAAVQNFLEDAAMFEWAGVGFGKQESLHIAMSLRKLAAENPALERLRLWGKVLGTEADYLVAEGQLQALPSPPPAAALIVPGSPEYDVEPRGEGANSYTYWVSAGSAAPWVQLPAARSSYIVAARSIKRLLTGNLESPVHALSWFPADERHLLRAQIARITATCTLAVKGWYEPDEDAGKNKIKESASAVDDFPGIDELVKQGGWTHAAACLLSTGRSTWPDLEPFGDSLPEELAKEWQQKVEDEPEKGMLEPIEPDLEELKPEDAEGSPAWCVKAYGDEALYTAGGAAKSHRAAAVRSLLWPGAVTVAQGSRFANLYVGYGQKCATLVPQPKEGGQPLRGASPFTWLAPGDVMEEPPDLEEQEEPNPQENDDVSDKGDIDD